MNDPWRVTLFGGLRAERGEQVITRFKTQKVASLFAYLASHPRQSHSREILIDMLWPESDAPTLRNSLSVALSSLRHQFEPPGVPQGTVLRADRFSVGLNPANVSTDVAEFERALRGAANAGSEVERTQHLTQAVELYQGPYLPGHYEDWISVEQERLSGLFFDAVSALLKQHEQAGDVRSALASARHAVAQDPLREESQKHLIRLLAFEGQHAEALRQYRHYERLLEDEIGEQPSSALRGLSEQIERASGGQTTVIRTAMKLEPVLPRTRVEVATVTFLVADIDGGVRLLHESPNGYPAVRARHYAVMKRHFELHGGQRVEESFDGFSVAFPTAGSALQCAVSVQQALSEEEWSPEIGSLKVRMAVHTGDVGHASEDGPYEGNAPQHAARMLAAARGGQILVSEATASLVAGDSNQAYRLVDLGLWRLLGISEPRRLFQAEYPGMVGNLGQPAAEAGHRSNLPRRLTRFFGRETEIAHLRELLLAREVRIVSVTGTGGTGKTRLSLEVAERLSEALAGAVYFVGLSDLNAPTLIPGAILDSLRIPRSPKLEPLEQAIRALSEKPTLLVLDNFEHLVEGGAELVQTLIDRVPTLTLLITSRHLLELTAERELVLNPLPVPGDRQESPVELTQYESVRLFTDRAQQVMPHFQVTNANAAAVAALVAGLEGIPLALELAAARVQVLTPSQMLAQLTHRFDFLASRKRDVSERQRTLRGAVDWSYRLLSPELQRFFSRLSVFRGGWTVEAAEQVCQEPLALDYLEQLRECSLVLPEDTGAETLRFGMLETLREYGQERLAQGLESEGVRYRHLAYFVTLAQEAKPQLIHGRQKEWLDRLETEHDNIRAALAWSQAAPAGVSVDESPPALGLRLAALMGFFWQRRGYLSEGRDRLAMFLSTGSGTPVDRAEALSEAGTLACRQADYAAARALQDESLALHRELGDRLGISASLRNLGHILYQQGEHEVARPLFEESLAIGRELQDPSGIAASLNFLGILAYAGGKYDAARLLYGESLAISRDIGDQTRVAVSLLNLGVVATRLGEYAAARSLYEESLAIRRELSDRLGIAITLHDLGRVACKQGDFAAARPLLEESLGMRRQLGDRLGVAVSLESLAELAGEEGGSAQCRPSLDGVRAAHLYAAAEALRETIGAPLFHCEEELYRLQISRVRELLDGTEFDSAWAEGRGMSLDQAVALALRTPDKQR
jgi:predicted ATPase/DNA-binding SARP family transcriptional activator/Tfp pilus assembly protein PilF